MNLESTIEELQLFNYQIEINQPAKHLIKHFKENPNLPGGILTENGKFRGIISQKSFWQYMSLPYSIEIASRRPIEYIYEYINIPALVLPKRIKIIDAVKKALERPSKILEEPLVVELTSTEYKLLDLHQLLIAQAQIQEMANLLITNLYKDMEKANQRLKLLSTLDSLTMLANRRTFDDYLQEQWKQAVIKEVPVSLIIGEFDYFKPYNEIYGHLAGDDALRKIADLIKNVLKDMKSLAARYGGDDFAIIMPDRDKIDAASIAEKIRQRVTSAAIPNSGSEIANNLTMTFGVACIMPSQDTNNNPDMLIVEADRALNQAKRAGRNRLVVWNSSYYQTVKDSV